MKKVFLMLLGILVCLSLSISFAACDDEEETTDESAESTGESVESADESADTTEDTAEIEGISEEKWNAMLDALNFENYTLDFQGEMTVTVDGQVEGGTNSVHSIYRVTQDAIEIVIVVGNQEIPMVFTGNDAATQKAESSQLYLAILANYDNFTYDAENKVYTIKDTVINTEITVIVNGVSSSEKMPVQIEVKEGTATVSEDEKILMLVCEYAQTMTINGKVTKTEAHNTTWTFSNYGSTVINTETSVS